MRLKMFNSLSLLASRWCNTFPKQRCCFGLYGSLPSNVIRSSSVYFSTVSGRRVVGSEQLCNRRLLRVAIKAPPVLYKKQADFSCPYSITQSYSFSDKKETETKKTDSVQEPLQNETKKLSLVQRFKQMYRDYWYVLVPVHLVTSVGWFGGFFYLAKSGVDVVALLESVGASEKFIEPFTKELGAGYIALAYTLYKLATPVRYTVTIGGTTLAIKYLKEYGYIKPIPPNDKLREIYQEKKDNLMERRDNFAEEFRHRKEQFKERRENLMEEYRKRTKK